MTSVLKETNAFIMESDSIGHLIVPEGDRRTDMYVFDCDKRVECEIGIDEY